MSYAKNQQRRGRLHPDLHAEHQPRPWSCSDRSAVFCTHHGDCTCRTLREPSASCPLHGDHSEHPLPTAVLR